MNKKHNSFQARPANGKQRPRLTKALTLLSVASACLAPGLSSAQNPSVQWQYMPIWQVLSSTYSPDGSMLAVSGMDSLQVFNAKTGTLIRSLPTINNEFVGSVAFSPDSKTLYDAGQGYTGYFLESWNVSTWTPTNQVSLGSQNPNNISVSPDGTRLAVGGAAGANLLNGFMELHSASNLALSSKISLPPNMITVYCVGFSPDGSKLGFTGATQVGSNQEQGSANVYNLSSGITTAIPTASQWTTRMAFMPDGSTLAVGGGGYTGSSFFGTLELTNLSTKAQTSLSTGTTGPSSVQFSKDGKTLLDAGQHTSLPSGQSTPVVEFWNVSTGNVSMVTPEKCSSVSVARFSPDNSTFELAGTATGPSGSTYGVEEIWTTTTKTFSQTFNLNYFTSNMLASGPNSISFSPDGKWMTYSGTNPLGTPAVGLFTSTGQSGPVFPSMATFVGTTAMSSDGVTVADGGYVSGSTQKGALELWNANTGNLISSLPTTSSVINQVAFSPDGKTLAAAGLNALNGIELWNVSTQNLQAHLQAPGVVLGMAYSPDGSMIAIGGSAVMGLTQSGYVETWNIASQQKLMISSNCHKVISVSYSPDGKTIADVGPSTQGQYLVELWDAATGNLITSYPLQSGWTASSISFGADSSSLFVGTSAGLYSISTSGNTLYNNGLLGVVPVQCLSVSSDGSSVGVGGGITWPFVGWVAALKNPLYNPYSVTGVTFNPSTVTGGVSSTGTVTIANAAPSTGISISLAAKQGTPVSVPSTVVIAAGQKSAVFTVGTIPVSSTVAAPISATYLSSTRSGNLVVAAPKLYNATLNPSSVVGGKSSTGTVSLDGAAPSGGVLVTLSSNSPSATVPTNVTVAAGATSATFTVNTSGVASTVTASIAFASGGLTSSVPLTITPATLSAVSFNPSSISGGNLCQGTVTLNGIAPSTGAIVSLSVAKQLPGVTVPSTVTIPANSSSANFPVTSQPVSTDETLSVTASFGGQKASASLTIHAATLQSVSVSPNSLTGGQSATLTITMTGLVAKAQTVALTSSSSAINTSTSVTVPANQSSVQVQVKTSAVKSVTTVILTAASGTPKTKVTCTVTVNPAAVSSISVDPSYVVGSQSAVGTVQLTSIAPAGGLIINLTSSTSSAKVPSSATVPAGATSSTFIVKTTPVGDFETAKITATSGQQSTTATLVVMPPAIEDISLSTSTVLGGQSLTGTVVLDGPAPAGGMVVEIQSSTSLATVPATVTVPAGQLSGQFLIKTSAPQANMVATITGTCGGVTGSISFTIRKS